jgi:hypothetical protein
VALLNFTGAPHGGRQRHLPEWQSQPRITPTTIIWHSIVGSAEGAFQMFRDRSVLESHFIVCGKWGTAPDGEIWQLMDTDREADANLRANSYGLSIETEDGGSPDTQPWTPAQMESAIWLNEQLVRLHPAIPRRKSRSCDDPGGLGYHTLHGAPSCWTPVSKTCPGRARIAQWNQVLLPAFLNPTEKGDLTMADAADILAAISKLSAAQDQLRKDLTVFGSTGLEQSVESIVQRQRDTLTKLDALAAATGKRLDAIEELLTNPEPTP